MLPNLYDVLTQRNWIFRTRRFTKGIFLVMYVMIFGIPENGVVICVNNIRLRLRGTINTVIDGPTIQCEVSQHAL